MTAILRYIGIGLLGLLAVASVLFAAYAARGYLEAECYSGMHKAGLDREAAEIFASVEVSLVALRQGDSEVERWGDEGFQKTIAEAHALLKGAKRALKEKEALAVLGAMSELQQLLARAKATATNRVNDIVRLQDPGKPDEFERLRLEGKNLVVVVRRIDAALETIDRRSRDLPKACNW